MQLILFILVGFIAAWWTLLYFMQTKMMFPSQFAMPAMSKAPPDAEVWTLENGSDRVEAWFFPAPGATADNPAPAAVIFHGNAEIIDYQQDMVEFYHRHGCSVMLPEYRGYGRSGGTPSQANIREDAVKFYDMLAARKDVDAKRIAFHGRSIGSAVATDVATHRKPAAIVLQSAFVNAAKMAHGYGAPGLLLKSPFRNDIALPQLGVPMLLFHGVHDEIIPVSHGRALHKLLPNAKYVELNCGHNDFPGKDEELFTRELEAFLRETNLAN